MNKSHKAFLILFPILLINCFTGIQAETNRYTITTYKYTNISITAFVNATKMKKGYYMFALTTSISLGNEIDYADFNGSYRLFSPSMNRPIRGGSFKSSIEEERFEDFFSYFRSMKELTLSIRYDYLENDSTMTYYFESNWIEMLVLEPTFPWYILYGSIFGFIGLVIVSRLFVEFLKSVNQNRKTRKHISELKAKGEIDPEMKKEDIEIIMEDFEVDDPPIIICPNCNAKNPKSLEYCINCKLSTKLFETVRKKKSTIE